MKSLYSHFQCLSDKKCLDYFYFKKKKKKSPCEKEWVSFPGIFYKWAKKYLRLGLRETLKEKNLSNISWAQYFPWGILFNLQARSPSAHLKLPFLEKSACKVDLELASGS